LQILSLMLPRISGAAALAHKDGNSKETSDTKSHEAATIIALRLSRPRGEHCGRGRGQWRGLIDKGVNARDVVDLNFVK
jgi:hypothetical protein